MSAPALITASARDAGRETGRRLRRKGYIPAVIYGHRDETKNIKVVHNELRNLVVRHGTKAKLEVSYEDVSYPVFIKELQKDMITGNLLSADFQILYQDEVTRIEIPVSFHNAASVTEYILHEDLNTIEIEALPRYIPEKITVDVTGMTPDRPIRIKDLELFSDSNIKIMDDPDSLVASAHFKKELVEEEPETETIEPELIGEKREEEE